MDDDDDNNNVNKMKTIGGNIMDQIMTRSLAQACTEHVGKVVLLQGWVKKIRHLGNVSFYYYGTERQLFNVY